MSQHGRTYQKYDLEKGNFDLDFVSWGPLLFPGGGGAKDLGGERNHEPSDGE